MTDINIHLDNIDLQIGGKNYSKILLLKLLIKDDMVLLDIMDLVKLHY